MSNNLKSFGKDEGTPGKKKRTYKKGGVERQKFLSSPSVIKLTHNCLFYWNIFAVAVDLSGIFAVVCKIAVNENFIDSGGELF